MTLSAERIFAATSRKSLRVHCPMGLASSGIYGYLRSRACDPGESLVFDVGRLWSVDAPCIKAGSPRMVVVYFLHDSAEHMDSCWEQLEASLAIDADVFRFVPSDAGGASYSAAFLFSHLSPLVGPMTYREVQLAVEHYLGWCSKLDRNTPRWKSAERMTVELVPPSKRIVWFKAREKGLSDRVDRDFSVGWGFPCTPPCRGGVTELITSTLPEATDLLTDSSTDAVDNLLICDEQGEGDRRASHDNVSSDNVGNTTEDE